MVWKGIWTKNDTITSAYNKQNEIALNRYLDLRMGLLKYMFEKMTGSLAFCHLMQEDI